MTGVTGARRKRFGKNVTVRPLKIDKLLPNGVRLLGPAPALLGKTAPSKRPAKIVAQAEAAQREIKAKIENAPDDLRKSLMVAYDAWGDVLDMHKPPSRSGQGVKRTADGRLAMAFIAGEAEYRARVGNRKLIDDVLVELAAELRVSIATLLLWRQQTKTSSNPHLRRAYRAARRFGWASKNLRQTQCVETKAFN